MIEAIIISKMIYLMNVSINNRRDEKNGKDAYETRSMGITDCI